MFDDWTWVRFIVEVILFAAAIEMGAFFQRKKDKKEFTWECPEEGCYFKVGSNAAEWTLQLAETHEEHHQ
jgi:hypothetical protein